MDTNEIKAGETSGADNVREALRSAQPRLVGNQAVASEVDHPSVDKDPSGDTRPHPSNRIDFNDPLPRAEAGETAEKHDAE